VTTAVFLLICFQRKMETKKTEPAGKKKKQKIHVTLVKVTNDNVDEVAKAIVEKICKASGPKHH